MFAVKAGKPGKALATQDGSWSVMPATRTARAYPIPWGVTGARASGAVAAKTYDAVEESGARPGDGVHDRTQRAGPEPVAAAVRRTRCRR
ncbi:hypothetical protein [Streptomyces sp. NPDC051109]|uniref:hypothetical protein n=1 Tax=Streptomyces sp. NPDC051109 TaxID=3365642 RepID=UPI0037BB29A0